MHAPLTILFGACDRHNLGDLLFPHVVARLLPGFPVLHAGLASRDLRRHGGHFVMALANLAREFDAIPVNLIHVGGEILSCTAADAALMLLDPSDAAVTPSAQKEQVAKILDTPTLAPYVASKLLFAQPAYLIHNAVGGATLHDADPALQQEVVASLQTADRVTVRDQRTQRWLAGRGVEAALLPDPGVSVARLFASEIDCRRRGGPVGEVKKKWSQGHVAVQFSADFSDDATLDTLARQFDLILASTGLVPVFFRAGAAPMHDDLGLYRKLQDRMRYGAQTQLFESLNIWDICALIAESRGFVGSSLHGRIVALAHGLPRVTLAQDPHAPSKHLAFVETWEDPAMPGVVALHQTADALLSALSVPAERSVQTARRLTQLYLEGATAWASLLAPPA
jgi:hypothetical protein